MAPTVYISDAETDRQREYISAVREYNQRRLQAEGRAPCAFTQTFGCQQNENDTERINGMLEQMGYLFTDRPEEADFILYNTCAVRDHAERKVYGKVGALQSVKRLRPDCVIALCGCMMQQQSVSEQIKAKYRQVDLLFGPHALYRFPENLWKVLETRQRVFDNDPSDGAVAEGLPIRRSDPVHAWVSIMSGCNNFCTYCIVPYVRGRERSRRPKDVLREVEGLVRAGYKEITLLGQNVNSYCNDLPIEYDFADLLREIDALGGSFTVSFMTSHPKDLSDKLIQTIADCPRISRRLHLPFQSGSNRILKLMNRKYTREDYLELIRKARASIDGVLFTSDVIVGFPTETEAEFQETLSLIREVDFDGLFTFIYSPRQGTPAAAMEQISDEVKGERYKRLSALQYEMSEQANARLVGSTVDVRVTGGNPKYPDHIEGRTKENKIVLFRGDTRAVGAETKVVVQRATYWAVFGTEEMKNV